jgi:methionyl-tRNA synthetase
MNPKEAIQFDDFAKMDIRVGTNSRSRENAKSKQTFIESRYGIDVRTIVSGIAESFKPEDIIGKKVTFSN